MTLRRHDEKILADIAAAPASAWRKVNLDLPQRKYKTPRVIEKRVKLTGYDGEVRQLYIQDLGHDLPTILLTNDTKSTVRQLITRYAQRMLIENSLAEAVDFFHLDALSSAVALKVDFDVLLTVVASGLYRRFAKNIRGYERAKARQLFRCFIDTPGGHQGRQRRGHCLAAEACAQSTSQCGRNAGEGRGSTLVVWTPIAAALGLSREMLGRSRSVEIQASGEPRAATSPDRP